MPDDWSWMWTSDAGRDRMLRDEVEGLQGQATMARAQTARLSSQLANLQGSLASRLDALSSAFDAYVELGDVREELDGYPDTSAVRRAASAAIQTMTRGGTPDRIVDRGQGYWLAYAVNALIGLVSGQPDAAADTHARELDHEAELFIVAAAAALGHGPDVAARLPNLLVCDGGLTPTQVTLWRAVLDGHFGDVLDSVGPVWRPALALDGERWAGWAKGRSRTISPTEALRWIDAELTGNAPDVTPAADPVAADALVLSGEPAPQTEVTETKESGPDALDGLRTIVGRLISQGMGEEVTLLTRARVLRARIEDPGSRTADAEEEGEPALTDLTEEVQMSLVAAPRGSAARQTMLDWVLPGLSAATSTLETAAEQEVVEPVEARTAGGVIRVGATGPDPDRVARADAGLVQLHDVPASKVVVPGAVAGIALVVVLVAVVADIKVLAVLLVLAAVAAGIVALAALRDRRAGQLALARSRTATSNALADAQRRAEDAERARADAVAEAHRLALVINDRVKELGRQAATTP